MLFFSLKIDQNIAKDCYRKLLGFIIGTPLKSGRVTHFFFENLYFLVINVHLRVFKVSELILWYLNMFSIDLATRFKSEMYLLNREKH